MPTRGRAGRHNQEHGHDRISRVLGTWTAGLSDAKAPVQLFEKVRDIPYGTIGSRDPLAVLEMNRGTCSGKHFLLGSLYRRMGISVKGMVARHTYAELPRSIDYPENLKELLERGDGIPDYHNFIKIHFMGRWMTLDATFDSGLRDCFVVNDWDGDKDTELSVKAQDIWEPAYPRDFKINKLSELSPDIQRKRETFLEAFSKWLETLRKQR